MNEVKKLRNIFAPVLTGERKDNVARYKACAEEYAVGTYDHLVWRPACKRECDNCPYRLTHMAYMQAMTDNAVRQ